MADYFEQTVVQQTISDADMTPLERLLLSQTFQSERDGDGWYFFAEECPATMIVVDRESLVTALAETGDGDSSVHAYVTEQLTSTAADEAEIDLDLSGTSWEFMLQDIVKRSATLDHVSVVSAFTCSKMRPDGFGGMAVLITADPSLTTVGAEDIADADIRAACLAVVERTDLSEERGAAVFNAAIRAIRQAEQRRAPSA